MIPLSTLHIYRFVNRDDKFDRFKEIREIYKCIL